MARVYLSLGSNLGDRLGNIRRVVALLAEAVRVTRVSSVYDTIPFGVASQANFLNLVVEGETELAPYKLLEFTQSIERALGRAPDTHNQPRPMDIDLLMYDDLIHNDWKLYVPHPGMHKRAFVLMPLAEIAPEVVHPLLKKNILTLLDALPEQGVSKTSLVI